MSNNLEVKRIHTLITKIITMLENDLSNLQEDKIRNPLNMRKHITDSLSKLVSLIIQLNKLGQNYHEDDDTVSDLNDQAIIENFLRHNNS